jgi:tetratricopeptide (TPR) repeat protein
LTLFLAAFAACSSAPKKRTEPSFSIKNQKETHQMNLDFVYLKAQLLTYSGDYDEAIKLLQGFLQSENTIFNKGTDSSALKIMFGRILIQKEEHFEASKIYARLLEEHPENTSALSEVARFYYSIKNFDGALKLYQKLIALEPENENHLIYAGLVFYEKENTAQAKKYFYKITKNFPESSHLGHYYLGHLKREEGKAEASLWHYKKCEATAPLGFSACHLDHADLLQILGQEDKAYKLLASYTKKNPDYSVLEKMIRFSIERQNLDQALSSLFEQEKLKPKDLDLKRRIGHALLMQQGVLEALSRFEFVSKDKLAKNEDHFSVVRIYKGLNKNVELKKFLNELTKNRDLDSSFFIDQRYYLDKEDVDFVSMCKSVKKNNRSHCYHALGLFSLRGDDYKQANSFFKKSLKYNGKNFESLYMLGRVKIEFMNQSDAGEGLIAKALKIKPEFSLALNYLSYHWAKKDINLERSFEYAQLALMQEPLNGHFLDTFGYVLYRMKEYENALGVLKKASKIAPENAEIYEHIADTYVGLNYPNKAIAFYELASELISGKNLERLGSKIADVKQSYPERFKESKYKTTIGTSDDVKRPTRMPAAIKKGK